MIALNTCGTDLIAAERQRQINGERYSSAHDDEHGDEAMARAAAVYATPKRYRGSLINALWPKMWLFKPTPENRVKELVKAGALIAAEIDRLLRHPEDTKGGES